MQSRFKSIHTTLWRHLLDGRMWGLVGVLILAGLLRFINYGNRWGLAYDQAQFALVAKYAVNTFQIPLLGPFSSGGPFQTGGEWYWIVMMGWVFFPFTILGPWILLTLLTIVAVGVMWFVGKSLVSVKFGFLLAVLTAISPVQIFQSTNLTNQTPIVLFSALSILFMALFTRERKTKYIFLQSFSIGLGISIHIQSVALIPFVILTYIFFSKNRIRDFSAICLGVFLPWVPVLIVDVQNNFYNTKNMILYYTNSQAQVSYEVLGRRWLTFLIQFIPNAWSQIIGGNIFVGYLLIIGSMLVGLIQLIKNKVTREWWVIYLTFTIMIIILRYTKTPLFESFFIFINPFIILLSGMLIYSIHKKSRIIAILSLIVLFFSSLHAIFPQIFSATNKTAERTYVYKANLERSFPDKKFSLYDLDLKSRDKSFPLVLYLYHDDLIDDSGVKIGMAIASTDTDVQHVYQSVFGSVGEYQLYNLEKSDSESLEKYGWRNINPANIYNSVQHWSE